MATNKEQKITITSSSGLTSDEIDKMVKDAGKFAEEDRVAWETAEVRNQRQYGLPGGKGHYDFGDKVDADLIDKLKASKEELSQALAGEDLELISQKTEELTTALYEVTSKAYEQAAPEGGAPEDGVFDADYDIPEDNK